jgi:hypothetical protein
VAGADVVIVTAPAGDVTATARLIATSLIAEFMLISVLISEILSFPFLDEQFIFDHTV